MEEVANANPNANVNADDNLRLKSNSIVGFFGLGIATPARVNGAPASQYPVSIVSGDNEHPYSLPGRIRIVPPPLTLENGDTVFIHAPVRIANDGVIDIVATRRDVQTFNGIDGGLGVVPRFEFSGTIQSIDFSSPRDYVLDLVTEGGVHVKLVGKLEEEDPTPLLPTSVILAKAVLSFASPYTHIPHYEIKWLAVIEEASPLVLAAHGRALFRRPALNNPGAAAIGHLAGEHAPGIQAELAPPPRAAGMPAAAGPPAAATPPRGQTSPVANPTPLNVTPSRHRTSPVQRRTQVYPPPSYGSVMHAGYQASAGAGPSRGAAAASTSTMPFIDLTQEEGPIAGGSGSHGRKRTLTDREEREGGRKRARGDADSADADHEEGPDDL